MSSENIVCPVCTLYLRPGITLTSHLASHPKQKVIEALVRLSLNGCLKSRDLALTYDNLNGAGTSSSNNENNSNSQQSFIGETTQPNFGIIPSNHSFIYQQFMSTSSQQSTQAILNGNTMTPQYITIPTVFNPQMPQMQQIPPQMICSPYVYQQQQVIMSSGTALPTILPKSQISITPLQPPTSPNSSAAMNSPQNIHTQNKEINNDISIRSCSRSSINSVIMSPVSHHEDQRSQASLSPVYSPESHHQVDLTKNEECVIEGDCKIEKKEEKIGDGSYAVDEGIKNGEYNQENVENFSENKDIDIDEGKVDSENRTVPIEPVDFYAKLDVIENANYCNQEPIQSSINNSNFDLPDPNFPLSNVFENNHCPSNLDNLNVILPPDFVSGHFISRVEDFEHINQDDKRIIMNIGCLDNNSSGRIIEGLGDESMSQASENVSIRADEHMPARGEISGPESNGAASDTVWGRFNHYDGNSRISVSYDILQESWDTSNGSFAEIPPPLQSRNVGRIECDPDENDDSPTVVGVIAAPKNFKCSICGDAFDCLKERRLHHKQKHKGDGEKMGKKCSPNVIGAANVGVRKSKKLVIKPKSGQSSENNFDNVFTNKIRTQDEFKDDIQNEENRTDAIIKKEEEKPVVGDVLCCNICNQNFSTFRQLKSHTILDHKISINSYPKRQCAVCDETFPSEGEYNRHLQIHPLECQLCGKYFYKKPNMQLHMKRHLGIRPYKCEICGKSFLTKQKCAEHRNIHTGETPVKCKLCNETFKRHSNLVQHRNKHHLNIKPKIKKDYICFCGEVLRSKKKLAWHKEIHEAKPKACLYCSEKFVHAASLTRHMRRAHNQHYLQEKNTSENVECPICKKIYLRSSLEAHVRSHSGQKAFTCPVCNKDFTTKWNLKLHKWTHAARSSKPFKCELCKGAFIRETEYVAHMNAHKSVRPYTCNHCGAQFIRKYNCQRHVKEHLSGKSFSCNVCGKTFHRSYYLKDHMRIHNGMRPYACHICGKTSTTKSNHNKHIRIHHAREPVSTEN